GQRELQQLVREQLGQMIGRLLAAAPAATPLKHVVIVGNTVMHHLFCGIDVAPLAHHPFEPRHAGRVRLPAKALDSHWPLETVVEFLPCLGGFVGSDILAGIIATGLHESGDLVALMDLGTNGEVVVGRRGRILCTSTAAGPAFEGARISMGMRAATGAISEVRINDGSLACSVIGGGEPRGLCGSGLVDAVAAGLELKRIEPRGRMTEKSLPLAGEVKLLPADVRELQLAKGAIATGLQLLTARFGAGIDDLAQLYLAGAFGNYISRASARRIGLLRLPIDRIVPAGNTALLGAKRALFEEPADWDAIAGRVEHVALNEDPEFQERYAEEMQFPAPADEAI
ncbi:MAG TPA: ASKHA domain-containing protein, partial [Verrucomicrobiae bacterium]|nr:ASKHA domain-containing protein [Verrucomicrobiae bacterium]